MYANRQSSFNEGCDIPVGTPDTSPINQAYRFTGYRRWLDPEGYPAVATPGDAERH